ncbi:metallophosphoesterase family protein [Corynebacterium gerontici]|uniref:metallophosphoesterase family protein n=1 Tax=Corynebacterium gerontici TaxID=2079234 RepID=UPI001FEA73F1|nr:metallophosphoesterase [Corynebacterium gerontici]
MSDLHVSVAGNEAVLDRLQPQSADDWLLVAGDVAERQTDILSTLALLARRYRQVVWSPGNHELFSVGKDEATGRKKYDALVRGCRELGVLTPEDPYANFHGVRVVPLFTLYDYSLRPTATSLDQAMESAKRKGVMLSDEMFIAPYVDIRGWCWERLSYSVNRVGRLSEPCVLMNHWPLEPALLEVLGAPEMSLWCGTKHTRGWAERYHAQAVVYGHLHTPGVRTIAGVPHYEVSLGYPKQWRDTLEARSWPAPVLEVGHGA